MFCILRTYSYVRHRYQTEGYGKLRHWEGNDGEVWSKAYDGAWYDYQNLEWDSMNSSVMPDKIKGMDTFPDHIFTSKAIEALESNHNKSSSYYMVALGFKMPHLALHIPFQYFDMYRNISDQWETNVREEHLQFPRTAPIVGFRCCSDAQFKYMQEEGAKRSEEFLNIDDLNQTRTVRMHKELMWGYSAAVSYVDAQLGRLLDAVDRLKLWDNLTIVLTSDHGMHNGEKGIWEKWSLFEESTSVPLLIHHPHSPFAGKELTVCSPSNPTFKNRFLILYFLQGNTTRSRSS
jgi:arylsulfatase A-like enzyme